MNRKMIKKTHIFTVIVAGLTIINLTAQNSLSEIGVGTRKQPISIGFTIQNNSMSTTVYLHVSKDKKHWRYIPIRPQSTHEFRCIEENKYVRIITNTKDSFKVSREVLYKIDCNRGRRYSLGWNREKKLWDVYILDLNEN